MKEINFDGIGEVVVTMGVNADMGPGMVVRMVESDWVTPGLDRQDFVGVLLNVNGYYGSVQIKGFATVPYTGDMAPGWRKLVTNGMNGVRMDDEGERYLVVRINEDEKTAVILL